MPFLLAMDLPVGSQVPFESNPQLPLDPIQLRFPWRSMKGTLRASIRLHVLQSWLSSLPRQWCGTFEPFDGNPTVDVTLDITS